MNKLKSRKFQVFIIWLVLVLFSFINTNIQSSTQELILQFFGRVSIIYIGGNVFQKYIERKKSE